MTQSTDICVQIPASANDELLQKAEALAISLELPLVSEALETGLVLQVSDVGLNLLDTASGMRMHLDYLDKRFTQVSGRDPLVKAILGKGDSLSGLRVMDTTLGLGRDAFGLCMRGVMVMGFETQPVLIELVRDALSRVKDLSIGYSKAVGNMKLYSQDARLALAGLITKGEAACSKVDVIYLDPMFEDTHGQAQVKKEAQFLRQLVGDPVIEQSEALLMTALQVMQLGGGRVVVKRRPDARALAFEQVGLPHHSVEARLTRFDVYT